MRIEFGGATVTVEAEGCIKCGTLWSHRWKVARTLPVTVGSRTGSVDLHICGECSPDKLEGITEGQPALEGSV